jgi:hypothetical protein
MTQFNHTPETDAIIRAAYESGRFLEEVARELGISKNAVIGRANRLGLSRAGNQNRAVSEKWKNPEFFTRVSNGMKQYWARRKSA